MDSKVTETKRSYAAGVSKCARSYDSGCFKMGEWQNKNTILGFCKMEG